MSVLRIRKVKGFTTVSNAPFENQELSWEARGLLAYLLTKPDNWMVRVNDLINNGPAGRDKVRRMLRELQAAGHVVRKRVQDPETKRFDWLSEVYEKPIDVKPVDGSPVDGNATDGKPVDIVKTEQIKTELEIYNKDLLDLKARFSLEMTKATYDQLISPISTLTHNGTIITLVTSANSAEWLKRNYQTRLEDMLGGQG